MKKKDPDWTPSQASFGTIEKPLDVSVLGVPLADIKLLTMLMNDEQHKKVLSLTEQRVEELDQLAKKLLLDTNKFVYFGRSRLNDETGRSLECIFYGQNS